MRQKSSVIWKMLPDDDFIKLVQNSKTYKEILSRFELKNKGNNNNTLKKRIKELNIDISHIKNHNNFQAMVDFNKDRSFSLEKVMVENSDYNRTHLKTRLLKEGILKNKCSICDQKGEWNGKSLVMILDHINGISNDNRIENLRMVCPNCNSQLDTHAGRNRHIVKKYYYCKCGGPITKNSILCNKCSGIERRKIERPPKEELEKLVNEMPMTKIGLKYNVSDNAVKKWCKNYGIYFENRKGYWAKELLTRNIDTK